VVQKSVVSTRNAFREIPLLTFHPAFAKTGILETRTSVATKFQALAIVSSTTIASQKKDARPGEITGNACIAVQNTLVHLIWSVKQLIMK
jgi:hypothetical protein